MKPLALCAIIKPRTLEVEFIDVDAKLAPLAEQMTNTLKSVLPQASSSANPPKTISAVAHVEPGEQAVFGALLSALYEFTYGDKANKKGQSACAYAIYKMRQDTAFIVRAKEEESGFTTNYTAIECASLETAKQAIKESREIKMLRDFQELSGLLNRKPPQA